MRLPRFAASDIISPRCAGSPLPVVIHIISPKDNHALLLLFSITLYSEDVKVQLCFLNAFNKKNWTI
ncbi:hypothetical protein BDV38DRAFT_253399 [Aspergillus pseudotamarii]|uniref:Uncharacterized protein n=1 Tax=Aspergillus pseudotamarii TaxID=132259 RepID=A0A5N6SM04_ASPPS|nr:uncharacterized protein BDV38DRAFT_253399 [Aspergillus pseudotamarii]KAE8134919.1 hypothetical protein BDV38DRAFT_253399 [Aspergillus pseudotamarii]